MGKPFKFLIGLAVALAVGWIAHGPLGRGEAFVDTLDAALPPLVADFRVPGVTALMEREPLSRTAFLSGPADHCQRVGFGSVPGIDERVLAIPGMGRVDWTNPPPGGEKEGSLCR